MQVIHSYIVKGFTDKKTDKNFWRVVALWGDESAGEGYRIGEYYNEDNEEGAETLIDELTEKFGLPVPVETIRNHFA